MRRVATTLGVSRSQLHERLRHGSKPRSSYRKSEDAELLEPVRRLVDERPTYGYRRIGALLNRERLQSGLARLRTGAAYWNGGGTCEYSGLHEVPLAADSRPLLKDLKDVMADENTVPVFLSMRVKCWCGYASDQDFLLDMPHDKAQSMQASELAACPDCGAPIRIHLARSLPVATATLNLAQAASCLASWKESCRADSGCAAEAARGVPKNQH